MPSLALPPSPGSSAPIPLGINLPFLLCPYSQREIFIAIPLEPGHAGGHMTQEQHLKVFLGFTQVAVKREKNPLISAGEGTRQSSVEKREGKQRDKTQGKIVSAVLESLFQNPMSFPRLLPACNSLFLWINKIFFLASKPSLNWVSITCNQKSFNSIIQDLLDFYILLRESTRYLTFSYNTLVEEKGWQRQVYCWLFFGKEKAKITRAS